MNALYFFVGLPLAVGGFLFIVYARFLFPVVGAEPFKSKDKNELWQAYMPYFVAIAFVAAVGGAALLRKSGVDFG